jgi:hypothetical protein
MAAKKSHDKPPASWKPWDDSSVIQFNSEGLRTRETSSVTSSLKPEAWALRFLLFMECKGQKAWSSDV